MESLPRPPADPFAELVVSTYEKPFENYEEVRELGKGSYGSVYLVKHKTIHQSFALKICQLADCSKKEISLLKEEG